MLSMVLAAEDTAMNKTEKGSYPQGDCILLPKYAVLKSAIAANFPQKCVSQLLITKKYYTIFNRLLQGDAKNQE